jgi:hypothetical protein
MVEEKKKKDSQARNQREQMLTDYPEDGDDTFLRNVG